MSMEVLEIEVTCPKCKAMFTTHIPEGLQPGDTVDMECPACAEEFNFEVEGEE